jgi:hypothetical protein
MKSSEDVVHELIKVLPEKLAGRYKMMPEYSRDQNTGVQIRGNPDIVIYDEQKNHYILLEVKGARPSDDLPLATVPVMRKLKEANTHLNPDMVLLTASHVPPHLKDELEGEKVKVIEYKNEEKLVTDLLAFLGE